MPTSFGYNCAWVAVKAEASLSVGAALGVHNLRPSSWEGGIKAAYKYDPEAVLSSQAFR